MSLSGPDIALPDIGQATIPATDPFAAILGLSPAELFWLARLRPYSVGAAETVDLWIGDKPFITGADDDPAHTFFAPRLQRAVLSRSSAFLRFGGNLDERFGTIELVTVDERVKVGDARVSTAELISGHAIDGRDVEIRLCTRATGWAGGIPMFWGTAQNWRASSDGVVQIILRGISFPLDTALSPATFTGTGGLEGGTELAGKRKNICFGNCFNISPVGPLGTGETNLEIYLCHHDADGNPAPVQAITAVKINGTPLNFSTNYASIAALAAATVPAGEYATCTAEGAIRLGSGTTGTVTADVQGAVIDGAFVSLPGAMIRHAAMSYGPRLASSRVDLTGLGNLDTDRPWALGRYVGLDDGVTALEFINEVANSVEAGVSDTRDGKLTAYSIKVPVGGFNAAFRSRNLVAGSFSRRDVPVDLAPALKRVTIGYGRNWTVLSQIDLLVTGATRTRLSEDYQRASATQVVARHLEAKELTVDTLHSTSAGAAEHAALLLLLGDGATFPVAFTATQRAARLDPGTKAALTYEREGLDAALVAVTGITIDSRAGEFAVEGFYRGG